MYLIIVEDDGGYESERKMPTHLNAQVGTNSVPTNIIWSSVFPFTMLYAMSA